MRRIELFFVPGEIPDSYLKDKLAVTIDVLRACTTVAYAFANGATSAVPAQEVEEATIRMVDELPYNEFATESARPGLAT